jgi:hypothetical protein
MRGAIPDHVRNIVAIANVDGFRGLVERRIHQWSTPTIARLELATAKKADGSGVLAIFVPKSEGGPHRVSGASRDTNDRYYIRTASASLPMPHSTLQAMFGVAPPPRLTLHSRAILAPGVDVYYLPIYLRNTGRGAAHDILVRLALKERAPTPFKGVQFDNGWIPGVSVMQPWDQGSAKRTKLSAEHVIHLTMTSPLYSDDEIAVCLVRVLPNPTVHITARVDAMGMRPESISAYWDPRFDVQLNDDGKPDVQLFTSHER